MKEAKASKIEPKFKVLHESEELQAKNGNKFVLLTVEIDYRGRTQIQQIAYFLPRE